ncbi:hypothetical protein ACQ4M3_22730 [Leptolyngbya sp. AN03gr2]|uniref:hypothetical protein n=1 Tax=unclassified Leptolyngbya TaxID=2650499 RepID=UPI003D31BB2A
MEWIVILKIVVPLVAKPLAEQVKSWLNQTGLEKALSISLEAADRTHETETDPAKMLFQLRAISRRLDHSLPTL